MAIINKTGITSGGTIQAEHVTRAIDALSGGSTDTIVATGSFSGSLTGIATSASFASTASFALNTGAGVGFPFTGSARITGSLAVTGSFTQRKGAGTLLLDSNANGTMSIEHDVVNIGAPIVNVESSTIFSLRSGLNLSGMSGDIGFRIPLNAPSVLDQNTGSLYFDAPNATLYIFDGSDWLSVTLS